MSSDSHVSLSGNFIVLLEDIMIGTTVIVYIITKIMYSFLGGILSTHLAVNGLHDYSGLL